MIVHGEIMLYAHRRKNEASAGQRYVMWLAAVRAVPGMHTCRPVCTKTIHGMPTFGTISSLPLSQLLTTLSLMNTLMMEEQATVKSMESTGAKLVNLQWVMEQMVWSVCVTGYLAALYWLARLGASHALQRPVIMNDGFHDTDNCKSSAVTQHVSWHGMVSTIKAAVACSVTQMPSCN